MTDNEPSRAERFDVVYLVISGAVAEPAAARSSAGSGVAADIAALGVTIIPPVDEGEGPRLAPTASLLDAVRPDVRRA